MLVDTDPTDGIVFQSPARRCTGKGSHLDSCSPQVDVKMTDIMNMDLPTTPKSDDAEFSDGAKSDGESIPSVFTKQKDGDTPSCVAKPSLGVGKK
eukprot:3364745-Pyramimonas_sp.AAC.1